MRVKRNQSESGQESVWDYPRLSPLEEFFAPRRVVADGVTTAETIEPNRVLGASHPAGYLQPSVHRSFCEWKGFGW